ncbi:unnamed protein product [Tenebrio molitor]|nr:unnamed protein product [Tenebrio molitor]
MWDKLIQVYEQKSETSIHMLMQQWYNLQMKSDDDIAIYVARLEDLAHRLEIMGEKIPDQMLITKLLMTLPPTYKYFISAWESTSSDQRTLANLISRLTAEESRMSTENPRKIHWKAAKRIVKYLKGTINHGLYFPVKQEGHVYAFSDADYAGDVTSRKSTTGIVVKLGTAIIAWKSTRQKIVALSTTEAEYVAACQTVKELIWLKLLLSELAIFENFKATLHVDNESAIKLIKNPEFHQRSKHIDVRYHFIRDKYTMGEFNLVHVSSKQQ